MKPMQPHIKNLLKRLAVGNVCSEHEYLDPTIPPVVLITWYDYVVDNNIGLHNDPELPNVFFTVCEQYENTPLCDALANSYAFACEVWRIAEKRLTPDRV